MRMHAERALRRAAGARLRDVDADAAEDEARQAADEQWATVATVLREAAAADDDEGGSDSDAADDDDVALPEPWQACCPRARAHTDARVGASR